MKVFYINENGVFTQLPAKNFRTDEGFNIPEKHYLIAVQDDAGALIRPPELQLSEFETLFLNEYKTADVLGFMKLSDPYPAGFRHVKTLTESEYYYKTETTVGALKFADVDDGSGTGTMEKHLFVKFAYPPNVFGGPWMEPTIFRTDGTKYTFAYQERENDVWQADLTNLTDWAALGYFDKDIHMLFAGSADPVDYGTPLEYKPIEDFNTGSVATGTTILFGQEALDYATGKGLVFGTPADYGW